MERRTRTRFPLGLDVQFRTLGPDQLSFGFGRTVNVSSSGILIASDYDVGHGAQLRICMGWPFLLDDSIPIQLVAESRVVRVYEAGFAVILLRHQFRTAKRELETAHASKTYNVALASMR